MVFTHIKQMHACLFFYDFKPKNASKVIKHCERGVDKRQKAALVKDPL